MFFNLCFRNNVSTILEWSLLPNFGSVANLLSAELSTLTDSNRLSVLIKGGGDRKEIDEDEEVATLTGSTPSSLRYYVVIVVVVVVVVEGQGGILPSQTLDTKYRLPCTITPFYYCYNGTSRL